MFKNLNAAALGVSGRQGELIELALSHGFRGLDLDLPEFAAQVASHGLPHARRLLDSAKLKIGCSPVPVRWDNEADYKADVSALPKLAELAATIGCTRMRLDVAPASDALPFHENFELHRRRLGEIAALLAAHQIRLAVGFDPTPASRRGKAFEFIHSLDNLVTLLSLVAAKNIGVAVDLWALHASGAGLERMKKLRLDQVLTVDIADVKETSLDAPRLLPGDAGVIDSVAALVHLAEIGYEGPITPHPDPQQYPGQGREAAVRNAGQKLDAVWKLAGLTPAGKLAAAVRK